MRTRSSSNLHVESSTNPSTSNPKRRNCKRSKQPFILEESLLDTMADQRTMAELLRASTEGYAEAIVAWDRYKHLLRACPHHVFIELHQLDTFYNALNPTDQDSLNSTAGGNLLERRSGSLPRNTIANPKGELKAITTRSGIVLDGPSIPITPPFINPEEDERVDETLTNQDLDEYTIKVPPPPVQKPKPPSQINFVVHQRDHLYPSTPYLSRMLKQKQQEKDEVQIHKFWQIFKQLHINTTLADALILMPKYQKMLKALLSNKKKLLELANAPLMKIAQRPSSRSYLRNWRP
nr:hypothetical protein [Tanacetum cinerariifolium]